MATVPKISVVVICYNFEKYLAHCLDTMLGQTLKPFEIIVCDDASTDSSADIIKDYAKINNKNINIINFYNKL